MSETVEIKDIRLVIKIDNKQPVELVDLTKSLFSIASQFSSYDEKNGTHCYDSQSNQHSQRGCKYRFEELFHNVLCNCCSFFK